MGLSLIAYLGFFLLLIVVVFGACGLMFGLARLVSSYGKPETRWKRKAAVMVPAVAIGSFIALLLVLDPLFMIMIGLDPLGDYEAPLKHRYTVMTYDSMGKCDVLNGRNFGVVEEVESLYMEGDILYGVAFEDVSKPWTEDFALNLRTGKCRWSPADIDGSKLKSVQDFCKERDRKVTTPLGWLSVILSAVGAFFRGTLVFQVTPSRTIVVFPRRLFSLPQNSRTYAEKLCVNLRSQRENNFCEILRCLRASFLRDSARSAGKIKDHLLS